jgi:hypothetical protein
MSTLHLRLPENVHVQLSSNGALKIKIKTPLYEKENECFNQTKSSRSKTLKEL